VDKTPLVRVSVDPAGQNPQRFEFDRSFRIGRVGECDVCIRDEHVSRAHVAVTFENGNWFLRDLQSSNGVFVGTQRVENSTLTGSLTISLGIAGPTVVLEVISNSEGPTAVDGETQWLDRYFNKAIPSGPAGDHTLMVRRAIERVQGKQRWKYRLVIGVLAILLAAGGTYAVVLRRQVSNNVRLAQDLFYAMKTVDVDIARVEQVVSESGNEQARADIRMYRERREHLQENYNRFVTALNIYDARLSEKNRLILRVARIFGESELSMPAGFADEVSSYIGKWQSSGRFARAIGLAKQKGYNESIAREFLRNDLPPQFFYLALQESDFDPYNSGPLTRKGIAKGMWQFIPETALKYGLKIGPLVDFRRPDPGDERDHVDLATGAAARYIKDLYSTDAEASGLLVMACYNWGDDRVLPLVRSMPQNPRERNFWQLLKKSRDRIPKETYDYVFYIVSAAVIGEDPRLFGFDFDNPLLKVKAE
jgi:membrane-bound lytic murein transglycosylase D